MTHERHDSFPSDDELLLYFYGESERSAEIEQAMAASLAVRERYDVLCRVLAALTAADESTVPEPPTGYEARVWSRLRPRLQSSLGARLRSGLGTWLVPPQRGWALAAMGVLLVGLAFLAGRLTVAPGPAVNAALSKDARDRILQAAAMVHLERSEVLLVELKNLPVDGGGLGRERVLAGELLDSNRLFRRSASDAGDPGLEAVLGELERLLIEVAHAPDNLTPADLADLQQRIEERGTLFRLRILSSRLRRVVQPTTEVRPGSKV